MSYHVKGDVRFKDLPERILVREDGYMTAYVFEGEPIADYWYVPESECLNLRTENAKLRELVRDMYKCLEHCKLVCEYCKFQGVDCQWFKFADRMRELGIETGDGVS